MISDEQIDLYMSLFKGRDDLYAIRWDKEGVGGYMPSYEVDWTEYRKHKAKGGSFKSFKGKQLLPFSKDVYKLNLLGKQTIGIYPLLKDNHSYFIAIDFDKKEWKKDCQSFIKVCSDYSIPCSLERSRSGNGGHIWIFFEEKYLASNSRRIIFELLRKAQVTSEFDKDGSFDRLFPNQDYHVGAGYGNLIALPLNLNSLKQQNTCFLDPNTLIPFDDQWAYLRRHKKLSTSKLNDLYAELFDSSANKTISKSSTGVLEIKINNQIYLKKTLIPQQLKEFIREHLNFINLDYLIRKRMGKNVYQIETYFKLIEESENEILIPRGFVNQLITFCKEVNIEFVLKDERKKSKLINYSANIELFDYQYNAIEITRKKDFGVLVSPPGTGKTIMCLEIINRKKQKSLIVVHRKQLLDQWIERIQDFLSIPKHEIGVIAGGKKTVGKKITVAMIQSLKKKVDHNLAKEFGLIIIDECHHIPAKTFRESIIRFNSYYLYGITATPIRKNNDEKLIYVYIGNIISKVDVNDTKPNLIPISINIFETSLEVPFKYTIDQYELLSNILVYDSNRNNQIKRDVVKFIEKGKSILILSERKSHLEVLNLYLKNDFETIVISGEDSGASRKSKLEQIGLGHFQIVLSTGQFLGEGIDIKNLNCLFIVYPFSFEGKLIQYIGRIQRSDAPPVIIDYRDSKIEYFEKLFKKRKRYYNKLIKANEGRVDR